MLNKLILVANLTKDPELRYTPQGTPVCNLRLASSRIYKTKAEEDREDKLFITAVIWGKRAENCNEHLKKGSAVFVEGGLTTRSWEAPPGQKHSVIELTIDTIQYLDRTQEGTSTEQTEG